MQNNLKELPSYLWLVPAVMLVLALFSWPYGYYTLLRLVVTICAGILAYQYHKDKEYKLWFIVFAGVVVLFNPIIPVHLDREAWAPIDLIAAGVFGFHYSKEGRKNVQA